MFVTIRVSTAVMPAVVLKSETFIAVFVCDKSLFCLLLPDRERKNDYGIFNRTNNG